MNSSCLTQTETKSPFLIGVAGGTACGKVNKLCSRAALNEVFLLLILQKVICIIIISVYGLQKYYRKTGANQFG